MHRSRRLARTALAAGLVALAAAAVGCSWVSLTSEGESVRFLETSPSVPCELVGETFAHTAPRVGPFARAQWKVQEELETLARNEAARMGGNAVLPLGKPVEGEQRFSVYRCGS